MRDYAAHKKASHLFDVWQLNQDIFNDDLSLGKKENEKRLHDYYQCLRNDYRNYPGALHQLEVLWCGNVKGINPVNHVKACAQKILKNSSEFIAYLEQKKFCSTAIYNEEHTWSINKIIRKYNRFIQLLFMHASHTRQHQLLYMVANKFFMFCFDPAQDKIENMIARRRLEPLARMLYAIMWKHFGGRGWQSWHKKAIDNLKLAAKKGDEIVYIAGGSDINQLLQNNIYTIRIIDPFLPTQGTYYSRGWRFLVQGIPGDTIEWSFATHTVFLKRVQYQKQGIFAAVLSDGKKRRVPKAIIVWDVYNDKKQKCGQVTIERRCTKQEDFCYKKNRKTLISFNELYFITTAHEGGWGIDVNQFDYRLEVCVKQLNKPLFKDTLLKMRNIDDKFEFIQLGNCIN